MKNYHFTFFVLIVTLSSCDRCKNPEGCPQTFQIPTQVIPQKTTYKIGDTITVSSKFSKDVFELNTKQDYDMTGIRWKPVFFIYRTDSIENQSVVLKYFTFIEDTTFAFQARNYSDNGSGLEGEYSFKNNIFDLRFKLIAHFAGDYLMEFGSYVLPGVVDQQDFPGKCPGIGFDAVILMNGGGDNNIDLLKTSPNEHFNTWVLGNPQNNFHNKGGFCFTVVP